MIPREELHWTDKGRTIHRLDHQCSGTISTGLGWKLFSLYHHGSILQVDGDLYYAFASQLEGCKFIV